MQTRSVRYSLVVVVGCVLLAAYAPAPALAATCPKICNQKTIWGTGPKSTNFAPCECTIIVNGVGSGPNSCGCGICYQPVGTRITGYGKKDDGSCPEGGTDCGNCDEPSSSGSGSGNNSTKTTAPPSTDKPASNTPSPSLTSSAPFPSGASSPAAGNITTTLPPTGTPSASRNTTATDVPSSPSTNATIDRADGQSGTPPANVPTTEPPSSTTHSSSNDGLATWQIALIICSGVLVMAVVMMTITSCYCKTVNRMKDNQQNEEEIQEYEGYWNPNASGGLTERTEQLAQSTFNPAMTQGGRSSFTSNHSRPNSTKNMPYSEPTYQDERIGAGMGRPLGRQSLGSTGDLPGVFQAFPQRERRPSHEVGSRKNIAIEL